MTSIILCIRKADDSQSEPFAILTFENSSIPLLATFPSNLAISCLLPLVPPKAVGLSTLSCTSGFSVPIPTRPVPSTMVNLVSPLDIDPSFIWKLLLLYEPTNHLPVPPLDNLSP